jgi:hypothetical protein
MNTVALLTDDAGWMATLRQAFARVAPTLGD